MIYGKYKIEKHEQYTLYAIKPHSKGSVPKVLSGLYTSTGDAIAAIVNHERKTEGVRNAKAKVNSGV